MSKFRIASVFMIFALLFNSCNDKVDNLELNDGSNLKGSNNLPIKPTKLAKQDYYNYRDSLFTTTQDFYNFADSIDYSCFFTWSTQNQWKSMYELYLWTKYENDPVLFQSLWEAAEEAFDATMNGTLPQNTNPVFVATMDEIFLYIESIPADRNFPRKVDDYLVEKFDEVYEGTYRVNVQDEILSAICLIQVQASLMQANSDCFFTDEPTNWWKCGLGTAGNALAGGLGAYLGAVGIATLAGGPVGTIVSIGVIAGGMIGAAASCFDDGQGDPMDFQLKTPEQPNVNMKLQKL